MRITKEMFKRISKWIDMSFPSTRHTHCGFHIRITKVGHFYSFCIFNQAGRIWDSIILHRAEQDALRAACHYIEQEWA